MNEIEKVNGNSIGFFGLLQVALIVAKVTGMTEISWLWVFSPAIVLALLFIAVFITALIYIGFVR